MYIYNKTSIKRNILSNEIFYQTEHIRKEVELRIYQLPCITAG